MAHGFNRPGESYKIRDLEVYHVLADTLRCTKEETASLMSWDNP